MYPILYYYNAIDTLGVFGVRVWFRFATRVNLPASAPLFLSTLRLLPSLFYLFNIHIRNGCKLVQGSQCVSPSSHRRRPH